MVEGSKFSNNMTGDKTVQLKEEMKPDGDKNRILTDGSGVQTASESQWGGKREFKVAVNAATETLNRLGVFVLRHLWR